jgi:hypothetical protein
MHRMVSLRLLVDIAISEDELAIFVHSFLTPLLLVHAVGDKTTSFPGSQEWFKNLPSGLDKEFYVLPNGTRHAIHLSTGKKEVIAKYTNWILNRSLV